MCSLFDRPHQVFSGLVISLIAGRYDEFRAAAGRLAKGYDFIVQATGDTPDL